MGKLIDKKVILKKETDLKILTYCVFLFFSLLLTIGLTVLAWLFTEQTTAIVTTVIMSLVLVVTIYVGIVELVFRVKLRILYFSDKYDDIIDLATRFYRLPLFRTSKEEKVINAAMLILKVHPEDEDKFLQIYNVLQNDSYKNIGLGFYHIVYLLKDEQYDRAVNEYLSFQMNFKEHYFVDIQVHTLKEIFNYLETGERSDDLNTLTAYIDSKYLNEFLDNAKTGINLDLPF